MFDNARSTRVGLAFAQLGTFWTKTFGDPKQVRRLVNLAHQTSTLQQFESTTNNLAGNAAELVRVNNVVVTFDVRSVIQGGDWFYDELGRYYGTAQDFPGVYNGGNTQFYILPLTDVIPTAIQSSAGKLVVGVDFYIYKDDWIFFRKDPALTFPDGKLVVTEGRRKSIKSLLSYPVQTPISGETKYVVDYARNSQSPKQLELALASVGGLAIIQTGGILHSARMEGSTTVYAFSDEVIRVSYSHTLLVVGKTYDPDTIIGDAIKVYSAASNLPAWWRGIDWGGGISLDPIIDFRGLFLKNENVTAYAAGSDDVGVHTRLDLTGNVEQESPYWERAAIRETDQGYYLNTAIGLASDGGAFAELQAQTATNNEVNQLIGLPTEVLNLQRLPETKQVNPIDIFFRAGLAARSIVVTVDQTIVPRQAELFHYLAKELPIGVLTIILAYSPSLQTDTASMEDSTEAVVISEYRSGSVTAVRDNYTLTGKLLDSARIINETTQRTWTH